MHVFNTWLAIDEVLEVTPNEDEHGKESRLQDMMKGKKYIICVNNFIWCKICNRSILF
jgi:hypothetical protein